MKFITDIQGPQKIHSNDSGKFLTSHLLPLLGESFSLPEAKNSIFVSVRR